jgi:hypothetical protein
MSSKRRPGRRGSTASKTSKPESRAAPPSAKLSAREAARRAGISHVALLKAEKRGRISSRDPEVIRWTLKQKPKGDLAAAVLAEKQAAAKLKGLRYLREKGSLVSRTAVNAHIEGMIIRARDILLRIDCDERVKGEINRALGELATYMG